MPKLVIESQRVIQVDKTLPKLDKVLEHLSIQRWDDKYVELERVGRGSKMSVPLKTPIDSSALALIQTEFPNARVSLLNP